MAVEATPIPEAKVETLGVERYRVVGEPNGFVFSEEPRVRLINWRKTGMFHLALPWVHYRIEWFPQWNSYWLWEVYFSRCSLRETGWVSYPFLPNFYQGRPCEHMEMRTADKTMEDIASTLWMGSFNWDGQVAQREGWRQIASRAKVARTKRADVLAYWEEHMTIDDVRGLYYPSERFLKVTPYEPDQDQEDTPEVQF